MYMWYMNCHVVVVGTSKMKSENRWQKSCWRMEANSGCVPIDRKERASERAYKRTNYQCSFQHSHIIIINVIVIPTIGTIHANNSHPLTLSNRMHSFDVGVLLWQYFCSKGRYKGFSVVYFQYYAMRIGQYLNNIYWIWHSVLSDFHHYIIGLRAFTQINK